MRIQSSGSAALVFGLILLMAGCEEDVVAVSGTDQPYTLWGVLNPLSDTQFVRVFPIEGTLHAGVAEPLAARFVSRNLTTGDEHRWRDSVIVDDRGIVGHIFYAPLRAEYSHSYQLELAGDDERASSVEVAVPAETNLTLGEPDTSQGVLLPGQILNNPPRLVKSELVFRTGYVTGFSSGGCPLYAYNDYAISYDDRIRPIDDGWWFLVNLREIYRFVVSNVGEDPLYLRQFGITLGQIRFETIVANREWAPPDGMFDPNVLVQPGAMSNVNNGFGFIGAGYRLSRPWTLPPRVIELSGFRGDYESC